jgi:N-acyl homoserine lactone hydrolase
VPTIVPLRLGTLDLATSVFDLTAGPSVRPVAVWAWLVRFSGGAVLIDAGTPRPEWCAAHTKPVRDAAEGDLIRALARHDMTPEDVRVVALTHLHWDHCGGLEIFDHAEILVQQSELHYAQAPLWAHESSFGYAQRYLLNAEPLRSAVAVNGDAQVKPGLRLVHTPGHTPGSQSVIIGDGSTSAILVGDTIGVAASVGSGPGGRNVPGSVFVRLDDYIDTLDRLARMPGRILPGHEPSIAADAPIDV